VDTDSENVKFGKNLLKNELAAAIGEFQKGEDPLSQIKNLMDNIMSD